MSEERPLIKPEDVERYLEEERAKRLQQAQAHLKAIRDLGFEFKAQVLVSGDGRLVGKVILGDA